MEGAGNTMALPGHIRSMKTGGVLRQAIRLAACVYVPVYVPSPSP